MQIKRHKSSCYNTVSCVKHLDNVLTFMPIPYTNVIFFFSLPSQSILTPSHFTLVHTGTQHQRHPQNTLPSWLLACLCFEPERQCLAKLHQDIPLCVKGKSPHPTHSHHSQCITHLQYDSRNSHIVTIDSRMTPLNGSVKDDALVPHLQRTWLECPSTHHYHDRHWWYLPPPFH